MKPNLFFLPLSLLAFTVYAQMTLQETGFGLFDLSNTTTINSGDDFQNNYESSFDAVLLTINIPPNNPYNTVQRTWEVHVRKTDLDWHPNLLLFIQRTGNGFSDYGNAPSTGTVYQQIQNYNQAFFEGRGWINDIPLQFKLSGFSVLVPTKTYTAEIMFTLLSD